ncbi:MAG: 2-isopropylmalate synthase, partial [Bacillota bacterium]|nr:2-isopropylmalate synthase [Bacillota bacterium]
MQRSIRIFDTTLRDGEQSPGCSMYLNEKIEVAKQLEKLKVDVIEAGFAISSPGDLQSVRAIAEIVKESAVCSLARAVKKDIDAAWEAVKPAAQPYIHTFIATSPVHMQHKLQMTPDEVLYQAVEAVKYAKLFTEEVEFSAEDACRSDRAFLVKVFSEVIKAGATVINIPDTVGYIIPEEMSDIVSYVLNNTPGAEKVTVSVHCHNDLGMAVANSLAAVRAGATQVECAING